MKEVTISGNTFLVEDTKNFTIVFSTANNELTFKKDTEDGMINLNNLKEWFKLKDIGFLDQHHTSLIHHHDGQVVEKDSIITDMKNIGVGVFTADCVPVIIFDEEKKVVAAVHSGWKGTFKGIVSNTIDEMIKIYKCTSSKIKVYIGPHIRKCCYEVSEDLRNKFLENELYSENIICDKNLDLTQCIKNQLYSKNIIKDNIYDLEICTYCNKDHKWFSYRKNKSNGRMFSFIFIKAHSKNK